MSLQSPIANTAIGNEYHFSKADMARDHHHRAPRLCLRPDSSISLLTDHLGGKRAMLIGAAGTVIMNLLFGLASFWGLLWLFVTIRGIDGYLQAFGSPGLVKINAAWFGHRERGRFAGIFGFMINLGRFGIFNLGPALLAGFLFLRFMASSAAALALAFLGAGENRNLGRNLHGDFRERHARAKQAFQSGTRRRINRAPRA